MQTIDNKTYSIYCVYHDDKLVKEYKLNDLDKSLYSLYYTKGNHPNSFDNIQQYICEFTAQQFVLKNNIKTDYVGFCQYRRILNIDINNFMNDNGVACGFNWGEESWANFQLYRFENFLKDDFNEYIHKNYKKKDRIYKTFITNKDVRVPFYLNEIYLCKWEYFEEIVGLLGGFMEYIDKKHELNGDPQEWHYFVLDNFIDIKLTNGFRDGETPWWFENRGRNFWRVVANFIELVEGIYFGHLTKELGLPEYKIPDSRTQNNQQEKVENTETKGQINQNENNNN